MNADPSLLEMYGLLVEVKTKVEAALEVLPDHENRIRALERWRYMLPTSALLALGSIALTIAEIIHK